MSSTLYLLGSPSADLGGPTLPSNAEMLRYYHHLRGSHTVHYSIRQAVIRCYEIWDKAGIPTSPMSLAIAQMQRLVDEYGRIEERKRRGKMAKVREFERELRVLFFVGREDAMEGCDAKARKLLVASLMCHHVSLGKEEEECEVEFEASDDKAKLKLKPEPTNNNNYIDKKCEYWNWLEHDENQWEMDLEPSDKDDKYRDYSNSLNSNKARSKIKCEPIVNNNYLVDDEMRVKMGLEPTDNSKNPDYWNFFDVHPKMEDEPSITHNDDDYAAYVFEEDWNLRYPKYDDGSLTFAFVSVN